MSDQNNEESFEDFKKNLEAENSTEVEPVEETTEPESPVTAEDNSVNEEGADEAPAINYEEQYNALKGKYDEIHSLKGRQGKELGELRKFQKEMAPYVDYLKQVSEQQRQEQYKENPELQMQDYVKQQIQPLQEQQVDYQASKTIDMLQNELGDTYQELAPVMANVLRFYQENEPATADYLASNPVALVRQAAGELFFHNNQKAKQHAESNQQTRKKQAQSMAGTAKSNSTGKSTNGDMNDMSLDEMKSHLRKIGVAQRHND